jgi:hypothetical protein
MPYPGYPATGMARHDRDALSDVFQLMRGTLKQTTGRWC